MRSVVNVFFEFSLMFFFKKIKNMKNQNLQRNQFFGLLGHQVCFQTKQLKITNFLPINRCLHHTLKGGKNLEEDFKGMPLQKN